MNNTVTNLKAMAITLVVLAHSAMPMAKMWHFLIMFLMPLFLIMSGYVMKPKYLDDPKQFLLRRVKGLYVPYVLWSLVFLFVPALFHPLQTDWLDVLHTAQLIVTQMRCCSDLLGGYWFLNALFFGSILAWLLLRYVRSPRWAVLISAAVFVVAHLTNFHIVFLNLNTRTFMAAFFVVCGYALAQERVKPFGWLPILLGFALTYVGSVFWFIRMDMTEYEGWEAIPYAFTAVLGTWCVYSLFSHWTETQSWVSRFTRFIGVNTLSILTWHLLCFKVVSLLIIRIYDLPMSRVAEAPVMLDYAMYKGWWAAYFPVGFGLCLLIAYLRDKLNLSKYI